MCDVLLGGRPSMNDIEGSEIKLKWLTEHLGWLPVNSDIRRAQHARGYILSLLGHVLMPNKNNSVVHTKFLQLLAQVNEIGNYSGGSACLSFLYRGLDRGSRHDAREICGCIILLQVWAWHRLPWLAPIPGELIVFPLVLRWRKIRYPANSPFKNIGSIRLALDRMGVHEFLWRPYEDDDIDALIPDNVRRERFV
ncbi:serine/threonine-protein phosphatase 7 long form homolog [Abrus precatorius]|uniref:Serine/threonine-protein phosphatase 7 long form homolog n=1 Tax=Abrus precatorius TaxID=3816 RepID=A0A8B8KXS9_ABRPR|nr:serine/threonine-protein phosphatase 7 long form homolog [Abrus precatorius]